VERSGSLGCSPGVGSFLLPLLLASGIQQLLGGEKVVGVREGRIIAW
jgi:hypothetical protein